MSDTVDTFVTVDTVDTKTKTKTDNNVIFFCKFYIVFMFITYATFCLLLWEHIHTSNSETMESFPK